MKTLKEIDFSMLEKPNVLKKMASASRLLAELKGISSTIPNQSILIHTLSLQEAKDSSEIENIVTTHDDLFQAESDVLRSLKPAVNEVFRYRQALLKGYDLVKKKGFLSVNHIVELQNMIEPNRGGLRKLFGTALKDGYGNVIYVPPQDPAEIIALLSDLELGINEETYIDLDPLIKMAIMHFQFESIHPFYDGNGRTGRLINLLYLIKEDLLTIPILYLSRYIVRNNADYYRLLREVKEKNNWEDWVLYLLDAVSVIATETIKTVRDIKICIDEFKDEIRQNYKFYSTDLIHCLFTHTYTTIDFLVLSLNISRITATKYLDILTKDGFLEMRQVGKKYYFINQKLFNILTNMD